MPSRREEIAMSPDEIRAYLTSHGRVIVASNGVGGFPHLAPMNYAFRDEAFLMTTFRKSQKVKNLERDPRATLLVETGKDYEQLRSVMAYAEAEIIDDPAYTGQVMSTLGDGSDAPSQDRLQAVLATASKRVVLRFRPQRYVSWDHTKLKGRY
jgi:nitroimidazol reductase NimA-like FMN-containing flavoprotein (pyridoxamine 5'-phosphate oxidase superfamily)